MEAAGLWMFGAVAILLITTGLPAFVVLITVSAVFAAIGVASGALPFALLTALPSRLTGLLETDLLQALPLYVLMGALLNRLPLADILFRTANRALARTPAAPLLSAIGLGAMLAPMNGSVGASVATLSRVVHPRLIGRGIASERSLAITCVASTLGVVVPPSLVLILLGDSMLTAHTQAVNATGHLTRVINTQDVFRGALVPAGLFLAASLVWAWWTARNDRMLEQAPVARRDWLIAGFTVVFILGLLAAVTAGYVYAVEAAAAGAVVLFAAGVLTGALRSGVLKLVLGETMAITGALFALFVAATTFTLVFRAFGSDSLLAALISRIPDASAVAAVLLLVGLCAFVLDAFEIILVIIPLVMPALLTRVSDAVWVSVLTLLVLQASFLVPPFGYAVMMARAATADRTALRPLVRMLAPFLCLQLLVLGATLAFPHLTHLAEAAFSSEASGAKKLSDEDVNKQLDTIAPVPGSEEGEH